MPLLLLMAQIVMGVLFLTGTISVSLWVVFLPLILFVFLWLIAIVTRTTFVIDSFSTPFK